MIADQVKEGSVGSAQLSPHLKLIGTTTGDFFVGDGGSLKNVIAVTSAVPCTLSPVRCPLFLAAQPCNASELTRRTPWQCQQIVSDLAQVKATQSRRWQKA